MPDKTARTHTHVSNRASSRIVHERKTIFKSVLDNPFHVRWPSIPANIQNLCLARLLSILEGIYQYRRQRTLHPSKRKQGQLRKNRTDHGCLMDLDKSSSENSGAQVSNSELVIGLPDQNPPVILRHLSVGINQVTKKLEAQVQSSRQVTTLSSSDNLRPAQTDSATIACVFICRADVDPPILVDHIPHLVAGCNTASINPSLKGSFIPVKLVPLPKGSESSLAVTLGLRRVAVVAVHSDAPEFLSVFGDLLASIPTVSAPWLVQQASNGELIPTHIKQLRTSAPKDMKSAKEQRAKARTAAKVQAKKKKRPSVQNKKGVVISTLEVA